MIRNFQFLSILFVYDEFFSPNEPKWMIGIIDSALRRLTITTMRVEVGTIIFFSKNPHCTLTSSSAKTRHRSIRAKISAIGVNKWAKFPIEWIPPLSANN